LRNKSIPHYKYKRSRPIRVSNRIYQTHFIFLPFSSNPMCGLTGSPEGAARSVAACCTFECDRVLARIGVNSHVLPKCCRGEIAQVQGHFSVIEVIRRKKTLRTLSTTLLHGPTICLALLSHDRRMYFPFKEKGT